MSKKRKMVLYFLVFGIVFLGTYLVFQVGSLVYDYVNKKVEGGAIVEKFKELYDDNGYDVVLFASPTCVWCKQFVPVLNELAQENSFDYYYLDVTKLFKEDLDNIVALANVNLDGIPHLVVLKDKEIVGEQDGAREKEETLRFLEQTGVIEGVETNE